MKPTFTYTATAEPTIEQLAYMVAHLPSDDHARLISLIASITQGADYSEAMQLQYITDDAALTDAGRSLMSQIGAYAHALPVPTVEEVM